MKKFNTFTPILIKIMKYDPKKNYYKCLWVDRNSDIKTIKKSYRKISMDNHPDRNPGDKVKEEIFKNAAEAYAVLSDETKRSEYDNILDGITSGLNENLRRDVFWVRARANKIKVILNKAKVDPEWLGDFLKTNEVRWLFSIEEILNIKKILNLLINTDEGKVHKTKTEAMNNEYIEKLKVKTDKLDKETSYYAYHEFDKALTDLVKLWIEYNIDSKDLIDKYVKKYMESAYSKVQYYYQWMPESEIVSNYKKILYTSKRFDSNKEFVKTVDDKLYWWIPSKMKKIELEIKEWLEKIKKISELFNTEKNEVPWLEKFDELKSYRNQRIDAISETMQALLNTDNFEILVLRNRSSYGKLDDIIDNTEAKNLFNDDERNSLRELISRSLHSNSKKENMPNFKEKQKQAQEKIERFIKEIEHMDPYSLFGYFKRNFASIEDLEEIFDIDASKLKERVKEQYLNAKFRKVLRDIPYNYWLWRRLYEDILKCGKEYWINKDLLEKLKSEQYQSIQNKLNNIEDEFKS